MKSIKELKDIKGKRALVRVDFNVPMKSGRIVDDSRIKAALPTINFLRKKGAEITLISHLGRKGGSLEPVAKYLKKLFPKGDVTLLPNVRQNSGEEKNNPTFAKRLAKLGDFYVFDAFPVAHRSHATVALLPKLLPTYFGFQFLKEIEELKEAFKPKKPFLFVLGGAKFGTKLPLLEKLLPKADFVFVGGALANNFFRELGFEIGKSVHDKKNFGLKKLLITKKIFIPTDIVTNKKKVKLPNEIKKDEMLVDIGPSSINLLKILVKKAKFILWNGPLGFTEAGFSKGSREFLKMLLKKKAKAIIAGGDTILFAKQEGRASLPKNIFVSTGGGATLSYLANPKLPIFN